MKRVLQGMAMFVMGAWFGLAQAAEPLMIHNAWIREAPPGATALAGYMTVMNQGDTPRVLVGASSQAFGMVMLHRTVMEDGMAKMIHQDHITIPAQGSVTFEPNGYHVMLMKPKQALKAGDQVDITFKFENGETLVVTHQVRAAMGGMDHGSMGGMDHSQMKH